MKKFLVSILIIILVLVLGGYALLFTTPGNNIIRPVIESKLKAKLGDDVSVAVFRLRPRSIKLVIDKANKQFVSIDGTFCFWRKDIDISYDVDIPDLAAFSNMTPQKLHGYFRTSGKVTGKFNDMKVVGKAYLARGEIEYQLVVKDKKPSALKAMAKSLDISDLLDMVGKPRYASGKLLANVDLTNADMDNMNGKVSVYTVDGRTNPDVLKREFNIENSDISFTLTSDTNIRNSIANVKVDLVSPIGNFKLFDTKVDIPKAVANGKYELVLPDLDKLYFVTKNHMRGSLKVTGDFKKDKDLVVNAHSDTLDGKVDIRMVNQDVTGTIRQIRVVKALEMMNYPQFFDSKADAYFRYNLATQKGTLQAKLIKGHFLPTRFSALINTLAHFDITREVYELSTLNSTINGDDIYSDLFMKSKLTEITAKKSLF